MDKTETTEEHYIMKINTGMMGFTDYDYLCSKCETILYDYNNEDSIYVFNFCPVCGVKLNNNIKPYMR